MGGIPNTTPTPNIIFNGLMRKMNDTEFRVVMLVIRATLGWEADKETGMRKSEDWISSRQLKEKTGRQSGALSKAIDKCIREGWIEARSKTGEVLDTKGKRKGKNIYFRLGNSILFTTSSESEDVVVKEKSTSSETANAETANAESEDYKINTIQNKNITKEENGAFSDKDRKELITLFKAVNPSYETLFARPNQAAALERMVRKHGREKIEATIRILPEIITQKYAPRITTPIQLENKLGELVAFYNQEKSGSKPKIKII